GIDRAFGAPDCIRGAGETVGVHGVCAVTMDRESLARGGPFGDVVVGRIPVAGTGREDGHVVAGTMQALGERPERRLGAAAEAAAVPRRDDGEFATPSGERLPRGQRGPG